MLTGRCGILSRKTRNKEKELRSADLSIHQFKENGAPRYSDWTGEARYRYNKMNRRLMKKIKGQIALTSIWN
jgi:hypothetical protein